MTTASRAPASPTRHACAAALVALAAGCAADPAAYVPAGDLIELLPAAEVGREPGPIDLGTPAARPHLGRGWSNDEAADGRTLVWSEGPESELRFFLTAARDLEAELRAEPFGFPGAPEQAVTVVVNGTEVARLPLPPGFGGHRVTLPERALAAGENRLLFRYAWSRSPHEVDGASADLRRLAVRWDALDLGTGAAVGGVRAAGGRLMIPAGTRIDYYLRLRPGTALLLERLTARGARLEVTVEPAGGRPRTVRPRPRERPAAVRLAEGGSEGLVRLSLMVPAAGGSADAAVVLTRPALGVPGPLEVAATAAPEAGPATAAASSPAGAVPAVAAAPAASAAPAAPAIPAAVPRPPNVLVYLIDTLRADGLGCYGNPRPVSPHIDAFAAEAILFERAVAQSSWTRPSVASIFTGVWPPRHGVNRLADALAGEAVTMAELLRAAGYRTHGVIANSSVARAFGFDQGFDGYVKRPGGKWWSSAVTEAALEWLDEDAGGGPFFLYLHTVDPHAPYTPSPQLRARFAAGVPNDGRGTIRWLRRLAHGEPPVTRELVADLRALYDAETAGNDASFGDLVAGLVRRGLWRDLVVIVLSDHGEEFHEHGGWDHGKTLHAEVLDVPLIARFPGLPEGRRTPVLAQHVDLLPTLLAYLGLPVPDGLDGRNLLPLLGGAADPAAAAAPDEEPLVFSSLDTEAFAAGAVTSERWRVIDRRLPERTVLLYDRLADPAERHDLAARRPVEAGFLRARLRARELAREGALAAAGAEVDEELRRELRALGYID